LANIELRSVSKRWGENGAVGPAVDDVSFSVREATLAALLGPSGCGKSTTLRLVAGLETVTSGSILIGGQDVTSLPPAKRKVSMVFQSYALFPHLSVAENIVFGLKVRGLPSPERAARLHRTADLLGLAKLLDRKPSQLPPWAARSWQRPQFASWTSRSQTLTPSFVSRCAVRSAHCSSALE
jgi:sn-glycerol 3-phosphate transport system ATP-binding protein